MFRKLAAALAALVASTAVLAQDYPNRTISIVVPFAAGGPTDTVTRLVAQSMSKTLGQSVIVENVAGAGGTIGPKKVAASKPDGYTLVLMHIGISTSVTLYRNLGYNPQTDLAPIGLVTDVPMTFIARKDFPPKDMKELIAYVKANKDKVTYANAGVGAASHLCGMLLMTAIQTDLTTVPYKGTGPAMTDLIGGQVDFMCDQTTNTIPQIKGGKVKAYSVTTAQRIKALPDLPTVAESGVPGFQVGIWHGMWAPKGTPQAAIDKLSAALQTALKDPLVVSKFADLGTEPVPQDQATPAALAKHVKAEVEKWAPIIKKAGIYAD
ncbi:MAG TPA: tripartite tricarboxylate transporter substrate binding protein BugD [Usitatibacteraceae bacterium]|jgi:tripartite-type tricarboxylate transporter receptor subunit TctC|nr:tripartite tricarboxylate transporter substrate binding protein BugD [Usitatibacteraceae bacterium]